MQLHSTQANCFSIRKITTEKASFGDFSFVFVKNLIRVKTRFHFKSSRACDENHGQTFSNFPLPGWAPKLIPAKVVWKGFRTQRFDRKQNTESTFSAPKTFAPLNKLLCCVFLCHFCRWTRCVIGARHSILFSDRKTSKINKAAARCCRQRCKHQRGESIIFERQ